MPASTSSAALPELQQPGRSERRAVRVLVHEQLRRRDRGGGPHAAVVAVRVGEQNAQAGQEVRADLIREARGELAIGFVRGPDFVAPGRGERAATGQSFRTDAQGDLFARRLASLAVEAGEMAGQQRIRGADLGGFAVARERKRRRARRRRTRVPPRSSAAGGRASGSGRGAPPRSARSSGSDLVREQRRADRRCRVGPRPRRNRGAAGGCSSRARSVARPASRNPSSIRSARLVDQTATWSNDGREGLEHERDRLRRSPRRRWNHWQYTPPGVSRSRASARNSRE